jgi:hypothetical protein
MNELTIQGKTYISSKRAAEITGYAKDYVGQLSREGYIEATMVGRSWYVLESSIKAHRFGKDTERQEELVESKTNEIAKDIEKVNTDLTKNSQVWIPAVYVHEPLPALIPVITHTLVTTTPEAHVVSSPATKNPISYNAPNPTTVLWAQKEGGIEKNESGKLLVPVQKDVLPSMQNAWQEWFSIKNQQLLETEEVIDQRTLHEDAVEVEKEVTVKEEQIKPIVVATESMKIVPIHPLTIATEELLKGNHSTSNTMGKIGPQKHTNKSNQSGSVVITAAIASVTIIICAIAFIGSGLGDKYIGASIFRSSKIVDFLEGRTSINR